MIKIVSGHSYPTGSTVALVNFCNQLNSRGYTCVLYGPDNWHMDKCRSGALADFKPKSGDIILVHNIGLMSLSDLNNLGSIIVETTKDRVLRMLRSLVTGCFSPRVPGGLRLFLTFPGSSQSFAAPLRYSLFRKHYASEAQPNFQKIKCPNFACANFIADLKYSEHKPHRVAGIIGSIRKENNIETAIEKALRDGMERVILYGYLVDPIYFYEKIVPLTRKCPGKIKFAGFMDDQQKMYDSISDVYSAASKPWSMTMKECALTNTRYHGPDDTASDSLTNDQIFLVWKDELQLKQPVVNQ